MTSLARNVGSRAASSQLVPEALMQLRVTGQALVLSFEDGFRLAGVAMLCGLIAVALMKRPKGAVAAAPGAH